MTDRAEAVAAPLVDGDEQDVASRGHRGTLRAPTRRAPRCGWRRADYGSAATPRASATPGQYGPPTDAGGGASPPVPNGWRPPERSRSQPPLPSGESTMPRTMSWPGQYGPPAFGTGAPPKRWRPPQASTT